MAVKVGLLICFSFLLLATVIGSISHEDQQFYEAVRMLDRLEARYGAQIAGLEAQLRQKVMRRQKLEAKLLRAVAMPSNCRDLNGIGHFRKGFYMVKANITKMDVIYCDFDLGQPNGKLSPSSP